MSQPDYVGDAEMAFRDALERLKRGKPVRLAHGSEVNQSNVAKEANRDPSALRKSRYPRLIREIQKWIEDNGNAPRRKSSSSSLIKGAREANRALKTRVEELTAQRDHAMARLVNAEDFILDLHRQLQELKAQLGQRETVVPFRGGARPGKDRGD